MKKIILFLLVNVICTLLFSQGIYIETRDYKGYIFPGDYEAYGFPPTPNNFTPSRENIEDAEQVLREYFKKYSFKPCIKCQSINKKTLKKYFRQYAGKLAENGNKIIYINFIHKKERNIVSLEEMKKDLIYILGDGISFWKICIDITSKKVVEVVIDGIARQ